jgi:RimJ/RimL family protein N-acetyltransferase
MKAPCIETERLLLRGFQVDDFDAHAALWADPVVTKFIGGKPQSREEAWSGFIRHFGMWTAMGFGYWAVIEKATGRMIGEAGFQDRQRGLTPRLDGTLEAGWTLVPETHGKGFASETLAAMLVWADDNFSGRPVTCIIDPGNAPSLRLAERHGFRAFARSDYHGSPTVMFERLRTG